MSPVPIFNKARTGCRPFIEIYEGENRILTTAQEIDQMREYYVQDGKIIFQTHVRINGDITIMVHHGRSTLGGKVQGKLTSINICTLQFHTGFMLKQHSTINFSLSELDIQEASDKYSPDFGVNLNVKFTDETPENVYTEPWEKMHVEKLSPYVCFSSKEEYWQLYEEFGLSEEKTPLQKQTSVSSQSDGECFTPRESQKEPEKRTGHSTFFDNLEWTGSENDNSELAGAAVINDTNDTTSSTLIDIGSGSKGTNVATSQKTDNPTSPVLSDSDLPQIDLVDPFASLASDRSSKSPDEDVLLNFGIDEPSPVVASPMAVAPDLLINPSKQQAEPDLLSMQHTGPDILAHDTSSSSLRKNRSMEDLNQDEAFFGRFEQHTVDDNSLLGHKPKQPFDPFLKHHEGYRKSSSESNLLGDWSENLHTETLTPEQPIHHASSTNSVGQTTQSTNSDPFADLGSLSFGSTTGPSTTVRQHPSAAAMNSGFRASSTPMNKQTQPKKPTGQSNTAAPNYNVFVTSSETGVFGKQNGSKPAGGWAPKPMGNNQFDDILNSQGFKATSGDAQKRTLKELRAAENVDNEDPITRKVRDWSDGKERNIRALISSLHTVLWEGEEKWKPIGIHQLIKPDDVKRWYRRACLAVHPDKRVGEPEEDLARAIFIELNDSYRLFVDSGSLSLT